MSEFQVAIVFCFLAAIYGDLLSIRQVLGHRDFIGRVSWFGLTAYSVVLMAKGIF